MIDLKIIQERYASMHDAQLIHFAKNDSHDLTDEAMALLKQEFIKRNLDMEVFTQVHKEVPIEKEDPDFFNSSHDSLTGSPYEDLMYPSHEGESNESKEELRVKLKEETIEKQIKKCDTSMLINGIIFTIGFAVTAITFLDVQEKGGSFFVAWGAILFGGIAFFRALDAKKKWQAILKDMLAKKAALPENE